MQSKIKAIIFDIDGVMLDSIEANAVYFENIFKSLGIKYSRQQYIDRNHLTMWDIIKFFSKEKSKDKIQKIFDFGIKTRYPFDLMAVPKDAVTVIKTLSKKFKLGVVTARQKVGVESVLKKYGFSKYINAIVKFGDYVKPKPNPEPLLIALKKLKVKPSEAIYVGDMWSDVACAKAAGVKSIYYRQVHSILKKEKPDYTVQTFKQLLKTINAI